MSVSTEQSYKKRRLGVREADVEREIVAYLHGRGFFVAKIPNDALHRRHVSHAVKGMPDLIVISPSGVVWFLEVKTAAGRLTPAQKALHASLRRYGQRVKVVRCIDDVKELEV